MDILKINNCVVLIIDFFCFMTMFIGFLMMDNWLSLFNHLKNIKDTFFNNVDREVQ